MSIKNKKWISIDRAINEFRSGRPIVINNVKKSWIFFTLEHVNTELLLYISKIIIMPDTIYLLLFSY